MGVTLFGWISQLCDAPATQNHRSLSCSINAAAPSIGCPDRSHGVCLTILSTIAQRSFLVSDTAAMEGPDRLPEGTAARMVAARPRMLAYKASKVTANFETLLSACRKTPEWRGGWWEDCVAGERFAELAWVLVMPESRVARLLAVGEAAAGHGEGRLYNPVAYVMMSDAKFSTELNRLVLDDNGLVAVRS